MADYEISASYVHGFAQALRKRGWLTPAFEQEIGAHSAAMLRQPYQARWWSGEPIETIGAMILDRSSAGEFVEISRLVGVESVGRVVAPLVSVIISLSGAKPSSLLKRMPDLASTTIRNVTLGWHDNGPTSGVLTVRYPAAIPRIADAAWTGACLHLCELAKSAGGVTARQAQGNELMLTVKWQPST